MKRKVFLAIMLGIIAFWTTNVNAKVVSKDEIEDNSYVIGNYYYTRTVNSANHYDGSLTTPEIMLAATTIEGGLDKMIIYHKDFLGNWVNGLTGDPITPPDYFEIDNRNLRQIIPTPDLRCVWMTLSENSYAMCDSSYYNEKDDYIYHADWGSTKVYKILNSATTGHSLVEGYGVEYYILKDSNNNNPTENVRYMDGKFRVGAKEYTPILIESQEAYNNNNFYNIVSRLYYMDGDKKIYSEYSNIVNNGILNKLEVTNANYPRLKATITDVGLNTDSGQPIYYNVKFNLTAVDTTKYDVREFKVYRLGDDYDLTDNIISSMHSLPGSNEIFIDLYLNNTYDKKYIYPLRYGCERTAFGDGECGLWYLVARVSGSTAIPEIFNDISNQTAYSIRFDAEDSYGNGDHAYVAYITLCDKNDQYTCYQARTREVWATRDN